MISLQITGKIFSIKKNPASAKAYEDIAFYYDEQGRYEEALEYYDKAIELRPEYFRTKNNKGETLYRMQRYEDALAAFQSLMDDNSGNSVLRSNIAMCLHYLNRYNEAYQEYKKAIELSHTNKYAVDGLKILEEDMKKEGLPFPPVTAPEEIEDQPEEAPEEPETE